MTNLLDVVGLTAAYGALPVTRQISIHVGVGEIVALLGANGAGKTATLLTISGLLTPLAGTVTFKDTRIDGLPPHRIAQMGLVQVPEGRGLVPSLTVGENLRLIKQPAEDPFDVFPALAAIRHRKAGLLSGGEQQMLAIARAMGMGPAVLLVDELSLGLAPVAVKSILDRIRDLATGQGLGVLLVEQHVSRALGVADRGYVLANGRVVLEGPSSQLLADRKLLESSYLGSDIAYPI